MAAASPGTLTPSTVAPVTIQVAHPISAGFGADVESPPSGVWVVNRAQAGEIWARFDGEDPTVAGEGCFVVLGARFFPTRPGDVTVKLISSAALAYTVESTVPVG